MKINITSWIDANVGFIKSDRSVSFGQFFCGMFSIVDVKLSKIKDTNEGVNYARVNYYDKRLPFEPRASANRARVVGT